MSQTLFGTAHFVSRRTAELYYRPYYDTLKDTRAAVQEKITRGEIAIGRPNAVSVTLMDNGCRFAIVVED